MAKIEINDQFKKALDILDNTSQNMFITGRAGTGKSTLLSYFTEKTKKKVVVLAPTGVAALNVNGETAHSFFGFRTDVTVHKIKKLKGENTRVYKETEMIIIDEISMMRADLLDCVDKFLRLNGKSSRMPFGGIQMVFIGDLYQLPPVVTSKEKELFKNHYSSPYFFDSKAMKEMVFEFLELDKIYRQKDDAFIDVLNGIRNNSITNEQFALLNARVNNGAMCPARGLQLTLTTTNDMAYKINQERLSLLKQQEYKFSGEITGKFDKSYFPTEIVLNIKIGAQVMLLNNDSAGRWVNGSIGEIKAIKNEDGEKTVEVKLISGEMVTVRPYTWKIFHFRYNEIQGRIETETAGSFTQYPLRLAWAVTIHKSQGKTFERISIDFGRSIFACGQAYVALSRCKTLQGITLARPLRRNEIFVDWRIVKFMTKSRYAISEKEIPLNEKIKMLENIIKTEGTIEMVYLKANDIKSKRVVRPVNVGKREYMNKEFVGLEAYCKTRKEMRTFRVDRILEMKPV